jgi:P-type E1-E2 ATPase
MKLFNRKQLVLLGCEIVAALICVLALSLWFAISEFSVLKQSWNTSTYLLQSLFVGVAVLVLVVPEGILIAVPLAYGRSIKKMNQDGNIVHHIDAFVELAEVTSIVVEKTGILTTNQFAVVESYFAGKYYIVAPKQADLPDNLLEILNLVISVNSDYNSKLEPTIGHDKVKYTGNATQCALLAFLKQLGR